MAHVGQKLAFSVRGGFGGLQGLLERLLGLLALGDVFRDTQQIADLPLLVKDWKLLRMQDARALLARMDRFFRNV